MLIAWQHIMRNMVLNGSWEKFGKTLMFSETWKFQKSLFNKNLSDSFQISTDFFFNFCPFSKKISDILRTFFEKKFSWTSYFTSKVKKIYFYFFSWSDKVSFKIYYRKVNGKIFSKILKNTISIFGKIFPLTFLKKNFKLYLVRPGKRIKIFLFSFLK